MNEADATQTNCTIRLYESTLLRDRPENRGTGLRADREQHARARYRQAARQASAMTSNVLLRARPYWTAATALRHPDVGGRFTRPIALGYLRTAVNRHDDMLSWRAALALEQTGNGPVFPAEPPRDVEPEPAA